MLEPLVVAALALAGSATSSAFKAPVDFSPAEPRLGDLFAIYATDTAQDVDTAEAEVFGYAVTLFRVSPKLLRGIAAVPIDIPPRSYAVTVTVADRQLKAWLNVRGREFDQDELRVSSRYTTRQQSKELRARIEREEKAWAALWEPEPTKPALRGKMRRPVPTDVTAIFGTQRVFNGKLASVHYGLDLNGKVGDPIRAAAPGRVVLSAMRFTTGGTIVVDHGGGLFTAYFHMSRRDKHPGDWVDAGELIGRVGKTGRVTGPHLHLAVLARMVQKKDDLARALYADPEPALDLDLYADPAYLEKAPPKRPRPRPPRGG